MQKPPGPSKLPFPTLARWIFRLNDLIHALVAIFLLLAAILMLGYTAASLQRISASSLIDVINNVLFVIIILELLWTMLSYLQRKHFPIGSFVFIGIISSICRILLVEAQVSMSSPAQVALGLRSELLELGTYSGVILVLVVSYFLLSKTPPTEG